MPLSPKDSELWHALQETVVPLDDKAQLPQANPHYVINVFPHHDEVLEKAAVLDLHGFTVQDAYDRTRAFLHNHFAQHTPVVEIITGRGLKQTGAIKSEILAWFDTPLFAPMIERTQWEKSGGSLRVFLKKK